jgi:hypothetical protein
MYWPMIFEASSAKEGIPTTAKKTGWRGSDDVRSRGYSASLYSWRSAFSGSIFIDLRAGT